MAYIRQDMKKANRTKAYQFTIDDLNDQDLKDLREYIKKVNANTSWKRRIRVRPRGSRLYFANGQVRRDEYDTPKENAVRYDVYVNYV